MKRYFPLAFLVLAQSACLSIGPRGDDGRDGSDGADGTDGADGMDGAPGATGATGADGSPDDRAAILTKLGEQAFEKSVLVQALAMSTGGSATVVNTATLPYINLPDETATIFAGVEVPADATSGPANVRVRIVPSMACTGTLRLKTWSVRTAGPASNTSPDTDANFTTAELDEVGTVTFETPSIAPGDLLYWNIGRQSAPGDDSCGDIAVLFASFVYSSATP